jgi:hypothetical protein
MVTALKAASLNDSQVFNLLGNYGAGTHTVVVNFLNDAWGGTATTDRNMYVMAMRYNGQNYPQNTASLMSNGPVSFQVGSAPSGADATLLWYNNTTYHSNTGGSWYAWNGSNWTQVAGDPRPTSANGATVTPRNGSLLDGSHNV